MDLVRDFLDKKVVDRNGREMGRVDAVVLDIPDDAPPRVVAFEIGPEVLAHRLHPALGRWVAALQHGFGVIKEGPLRIAVGQVLDRHDHIKVDLAVGSTVAGLIEHRLRRWVGSIPRSS